MARMERQEIMSTPNKRGPAKGQGGRPKGSTKAIARTERLNDRLLPGTVLGLRRKAGDVPLFEYLANIATPLSRLTHAQAKLLRLCASHVSKRMWLPDKLKCDRQVALRLIDKGMIASTGILEGSYELTDKGREFLAANDELRDRHLKQTPPEKRDSQ